MIKTPIIAVALRMAFIFTAFILCYLSNAILFHIVILSLFFGLLLITGKSVFKVISRIAWPALFIIMGALSLVVDIGLNHTVFPFFKLSFSEESLSLAYHLFFKSLSIITVITLGMHIISFSEMISILRQLHIPLLLIELFAMTYNAIFLLRTLLFSLVKAQKSRLGYIGHVGSLQVFNGMMLVLFFRSMQQTQAQAIALNARLYMDNLEFVTPLISFKRNHLYLCLFACTSLLILHFYLSV